MNATIIGQLAPNIGYQEWADGLQREADISLVTTFNITGGDNKLNNFVRDFAKEHGIEVDEYIPNVAEYGENAKHIRNLQLVCNADFVLSYLGDAKNHVIRINHLAAEEQENVNRPIQETRQSMQKPNIDLHLNSGNVSKDELISIEEEVALVKRIQKGAADAEEAKEKLLFCCRRFVTAIAKQYIGLSLSPDRLIEEGNIGLLAAANRFDETRGFKFISYAVWWIRTSIENAIKENDISHNR